MRFATALLRNLSNLSYPLKAHLHNYSPGDLGIKLLTHEHSGVRGVDTQTTGTIFAGPHKTPSSWVWRLMPLTLAFRGLSEFQGSLHYMVRSCFKRHASRNQRDVSVVRNAVYSSRMSELNWVVSEYCRGKKHIFRVRETEVSPNGILA